MGFTFDEVAGLPVEVQRRVAGRHAMVGRSGSASPAAIAAASARGIATHHLIAYLARTYGQPTSDQIVRVGLRLCAGRGRAIQTRQAFRINVISMTGVYFNRFPRRGWRLVDVLTVLPGDVEGPVEVDLIWERGGVFEIDEIKTRQPSLPILRQTAQQILGQRAAAVAEWGQRAGHVRAAFLLLPSASFTTQEIPRELLP